MAEVALGFHDQLAFSDSAVAREVILRHLSSRFPGALTIRKAAPLNDRIGADYWIEFPHGQFRSVDVKVRREDWGAKGQPDIALEVWSNKEQQKPGWALEPSKITDYVLFVWLDTGRADLFDFRLLQAATWENLRHWEAQCQHTEQQTGSGPRRYTSCALFITSRELHAAIYRWQTGQSSISCGLTSSSEGTSRRPGNLRPLATDAPGASVSCTT